MAVETRYARSGDVRIAYQVTGEGEIDFLWAPGSVSHLDLDWEWPAKARFIERLGSVFRVIRFDKRTTGLSDRPTTLATMDERVEDMRAVLDAAGSTRAAVFGVSEGAQMACLFAASHPDHTRALVIWGGQPYWLKAPDYRWGDTLEANERYLAELADQWPPPEEVRAHRGPLDPPPGWMTRYYAAAASPAAAVALARTNLATDVRPILGSVRVPTLVMNRTHDPVAHVDAARDFAARIPSARFVELAGDTHSFVADESVLREITRFVTGSVAPPRSTRRLAALTFLDIVSSTERVAELGDERWSVLVSTFYATVGRELQLHGGVEVDRAGDGFLAFFDGPGRAVACAVAIREAAAELGLAIRAGVHVGEVEVEGSAVRGFAVHVAARLASVAEPGEVVASATVRDLAAGSSIAFEPGTVRRLKGVADPVETFCVKAA